MLQVTVAASEELGSGGVAFHVTDRDTFEPLRMGLHFLATVGRLYGDALAWRDEVYEFVKDRLAIDLLFGGTEARRLIDGRASVDEIDGHWRRWQEEAAIFEAERQPFLRYR